MFDFEYSIAGFLVGSLVGLTGMGGGAIMAPLLILLFGVSPLTAVGTDLAYVAITKVVGALTHYRQDTADLTVAGRLVLGGVPGAILGVQILNYLKESQYPVNLIVRDVLGLVLVIVASFMLFQTLLRKNDFKDNYKRLSNPTLKLSIFTILAGFVIGLTVGVTSVGSGVLTIVFLLFLYQIQDRKAVGTDLVAATFIAIAAGFFHLLSGNVDLNIVGSLLLGSVPGVYIGSKIHLGIPMKYLRILLSVIIIISGLALIKI